MRKYKTNSAYLQQVVHKVATIRSDDFVKIINPIAPVSASEWFKVLSDPFEERGKWFVLLEKFGKCDIINLEKVSRPFTFSRDAVHVKLPLNPFYQFDASDTESFIAAERASILNGVELYLDKKEIKDFSLQIKKHTLDIGEIHKFLDEHFRSHLGWRYRGDTVSLEFLLEEFKEMYQIELIFS